jgi:hypothetical protein
MKRIPTRAGWRGLAMLLVLAPVACSLYIALHNLRGSRDDGAITASYARTYVDSGRIALTPDSPIVEGMSSLAWMLLLCIPRLFSKDPDVLLIWMKCLSAVCLSPGLAICYRIARRQLEGSAKLRLRAR